MNKQDDALVILEEVAVSLKESAEQVESNTDYDKGRLAGYYEALSTLLSQCAMAGISQEDIGLEGFSAESLLSVSKKAA